MRGFSLGAIALVAACSGDGVYIEVRVPEGMTVDQVELYLATRDCKPDSAGFDCEGIVPPNSDVNQSRDRVDGEVYFVDDNRPFVSTPDDDGSAWFHLDPNAQFEIKTAIAVGRDVAAGETGVAIFKEIDLDVTQHLRIELEPVASQEVRGMQQPAVEVWGPAAHDYRCVAAEIEDRVVYIVPRNDPDCDQVAVGGEECLPGVYQGQKKVSSELEDQTCSTTEATGLCVLGSEGCDELNMPDAGNRCTPSTAKKYCAPDRACIDCADSLENGCFEGLFALSSRIDCVVEVEDNPQGGPGTQTCPKVATPAPINNRPCTQAEIAIATDGIPGFATNVISPIPGSAGATLKPTVENNTCKVGLGALDATFPTNVQQPIHALVKLDTTPPGAQVQRFLILPLKVTFVPVKDCLTGTATRCSLTTALGDHFQQCFQ